MTRATALFRTDWMTPWHRGWEREFDAVDRERTHVFGDESRRADVTLGDVAVEFQHSAISEQDFLDRTRFYQDRAKAVLWVFDRTGRRAADDLAGRPFDDDGVLSGGCTPCRREFDRAGKAGCGAVFLDYGAYVAMCMDLRTCPGGREGHCAGRVLFLTRSGFVRLAMDWGRGSGWEFVDHGFIGRYVQAHSKPFLEGTRDAVSRLDGERAVRAEQVLGTYDGWTLAGVAGWRTGFLDRPGTGLTGRLERARTFESEDDALFWAGALGHGDGELAPRRVDIYALSRGLAYIL